MGMDQFTPILLISALLVIMVLLYLYTSLRAQVDARIQEGASGRALELLEKWRHGELELMRIREREVALAEANNKLDAWTSANEKRIRSDAARKSESVTKGKVMEQLVPYLPEFEYHPKDARFIGSPVDFLVFDGLNDGGKVREVLFVEVKSNRSSLNTRERHVRDAIQACRVRWVELRVPDRKGTCGPRVLSGE